MKTLKQLVGSRYYREVIKKKPYFLYGFHVHNSKLLHLPAIKKLKVNFSLRTKASSECNIKGDYN